MADKELKDLIKQIKEMNKESPDTDIASSKEFRELSKSLHERHDATEENTKALKEDAETNKNFNRLQIGKEVYDLASGRDSAKKVLDGLKEQNEGLRAQKKHNRGAKDAREIILEQNKIIIGQLNKLQQGVGGGGNPGVDKALVENTKVIKKNQADISKADQTTVGPNGEKLNTKSKRAGFGMSDQDYANQRVRDEAALKREGGVRDVNDLASGVKTTGKSLNKRKISSDELETGALNMGMGESIKIGGKEVTRVGEYSTGTAKFKDDTGAYTATDPVKALAEDIRISQGVVGTTRNREQFRASKASGALAEKMGANAGALQSAMDGNDEAKTDLADLARILSDAQAGKEGVGKKEVNTQIEKLKLSGGSEISEMLDLKGVGKQAQGSKLSNIGGSLKESVFGVNQGTKLFSKDGMKQAFSADRLLGSAGTGGKFSLAKLGLGAGLRDEETARRVKEVDSQSEAQSRMFGEEGLGIGRVDATQSVDDPAGKAKKDSAKKEEWREKWIPSENRYAESMEEAAEAVKTAEAPSAPASDAPSAPAPSKAKAAAKGKVDKRTGQDTESIPQKQLETLIEIRDLLQSTADAGGEEGGGGSFLDNIIPGRKNKNKKRGGKKKGPRAKGGFMKGKLGIATKLGGAALAVGMGAYTAYSGSKEAERLADAGELNADEEQKAKAEAIGEGAGGAGGALAGAAAGAAIGSMVPIVGTAIGGIIGGAIGYFAGSKAGKAAGGKIADVIDIDPKTLQESNAQAEEVLKQVEEKDSTLAGVIKQEAKDIEAQMLEQAGDNISDNDKEAIKNAAMVQALKAHNGEIQNMGIDRKSIADNIEKAGEAAYDSAKDSGLYDKDLLGNSEIDKSKLNDASVAELNAIVADDDLSAEDMQAVKDTLAQKQMVAMSPVTPPTAQAVDNMTTEYADASSGSDGAPVVVNNQQNGPAPSVDDRPLIAVSAPNVRNANSTLVRRNDRTGVQV